MSVLTDSAVDRALRSGLFTPDTLESGADADGHFTGGQFDESQLTANNNGVLAEVQVGSDPPVDTAEAVLVGHPQGNPFLAGQTAVSRPHISLRDSDDNDEASAGVRVAVKLASSAQASDEPYQMKPRLEDQVDVTNNSNVDATTPNPLYFTESTDDDGNLVWAGSGDFINLVVLNGASAETYAIDHSVVSLPIYRWNGRGL